jgi:hypothetical protein
LLVTGDVDGTSAVLDVHDLRWPTVGEGRWRWKRKEREKALFENVGRTYKKIKGISTHLFSFLLSKFKK